MNLHLNKYFFSSSAIRYFILSLKRRWLFISTVFFWISLNVASGNALNIFFEMWGRIKRKNRHFDYKVCSSTRSTNTHVYVCVFDTKELHLCIKTLVLFLSLSTFPEILQNIKILSILNVSVYYFPYHPLSHLQMDSSSFDFFSLLG